ncbi:sugar MFS transporter [Terrimonas sp. NA20]|uniref:Sugar MFS transporter n=1 Tax=Terrimonas ginsenosidimutans TaxID=2908004 RepID=A0ABS9KS70_9BACT|nr:sugar MFS transporter [Terrimonas ginsenosidimutans]MCG2615164.1 sugar MFS transporter [Terrimonas ginsenosidimutans]
MPILPSGQVLTEDQGVEATGYRPALFSLALLYFMMGFITCLNDTLVPFFKNGFQLSYTQSSLVQFYFFLTYGVMSVPAGRWVTKTGYQKGMVYGFLISAFGALLFLPASIFHWYPLFLAALFVIATGIVLLQVAANPYITLLGPAKTASSRLTLIQGVGSAGTTVAPLFGSAFILSSLKQSTDSSEGVRIPYLGICAALLLIAVFVAKLKLPGSATPLISVGSASKASSVFRFRHLNFGIIGIFMYVGAEVSVGTFLTSYIQERIGVEEAVANSYVAFYWGCMLVGRLAGAWILRKVRPNLVLAALSLAAIVLIFLSIVSTGQVSIWMMIAVGLCNSVMFAIIFSLAVNGLGAHTTQASGLLSTAIAGGAVISFLQGLIRDHSSWEIAFLLPLICYVYLLFYGLKGYRSASSANS